MLARRFRQGLLAALPVLWPLGFIMLYSPAERWLIVIAVWLALLLHILLDQQRLVDRWRGARLDYSPALLLERLGVAVGCVALALAVAQFTPNLYIRQITARYYELLKPFNQNLEAAGKRLFPGLAGVVPWGGQTAVAGGLPNQFLLARTAGGAERPHRHARAHQRARVWVLRPGATRTFPARRHLCGLRRPGLVELAPAAGGALRGRSRPGSMISAPDAAHSCRA